MSGKMVTFSPVARTARRRDRIAVLEARVAELEVELAAKGAIADHLARATDPEWLRGQQDFLGEELYHIWYVFEAGDDRVPLPTPYRDLSAERRHAFETMAKQAILRWAQVNFRKLLG